MGGLTKNHRELGRHDHKAKVYTLNEGYGRTKFAEQTNLDALELENREEYDRAKEMYDKAMEFDRNYAPAYNNLGHLLQTVRKDYDGAEKMYREAIKLNPKYAYACWNLSTLLENQRKDISVAIEFTQKYIDAGNPDNDGEERLAKLHKKLPRKPAPAEAAGPGKATVVTKETET